MSAPPRDPSARTAAPPAAGAEGTGGTGEPRTALHSPTSRSWRGLLEPLVVVAVGAAWMLYVENSDLDSIEERTLKPRYVWEKTWQHIELTVVSTLVVLAIAIPLGIVLSRVWARPATPFVLAVANVGQSAPAIGVVVLLAVIIGIGFWTAVVALVAYGVLPALRNTMVGLQQVDPTLTDAGRGIGMSPAMVLGRVELPLATPVILAGIRTTLVLMVGTASIASFISGGGLGDLITTGVSTQRTPILLTGCILIALLALLIDWLGGMATRLLAPKGL
ncbi:ABC transporter permease [Actinomadura graeca]|uniref:ABC transporter permease n=1 Tax=Actinomadura graeca TaxID=2750812 RepID=A0ABX8QQL1_9ACTN|nr:ABC transporter permease [Actinomadura graeca]QXJ21080.1 ABC transporter permease [Actinomadura graeca]